MTRWCYDRTCRKEKKEKKEKKGRGKKKSANTLHHLTTIFSPLLFLPSHRPDLQSFWAYSLRLPQAAVDVFARIMRRMSKFSIPPPPPPPPKKKKKKKKETRDTQSFLCFKSISRSSTAPLLFICYFGVYSSRNDFTFCSSVSPVFKMFLKFCPLFHLWAVHTYAFFLQQVGVGRE